MKSGLEEVELPNTLKEVQYNAFQECKDLKAIWVRDDFGMSLRQYNGFMAILPSRQILVGAVPLWDLRSLKDVRIPDGVEKVGGYWFSDSDVESVEICASVRELGPGAFCRCEKLKRVSFQQGSRLEKIGDACFYWAAVEKVVVPRGVEQIQAEAFSNCTDLKEVAFEDGSRLREIGEQAFFNCKGLKNAGLPEGLERIERYAFAWCGLEEVTLPSTLREVQERAFASRDVRRTVWVERGCAADVSGLAGECVQVRQK